MLTTPADVITTRIMTQQEADDEGAEMAGPIEVGRDIWQQEGLAGFFKGTVSRGLYWAPAIGIFLPVLLAEAACSKRHCVTLSRR